MSFCLLKRRAAFVQFVICMASELEYACVFIICEVGTERRQGLKDTYVEKKGEKKKIACKMFTAKRKSGVLMKMHFRYIEEE